MKDDLNYEKDYGPIVCDESEIEQLLEGRRKEKAKLEEKKERKYIEIKHYTMIALLTISVILEFGYGLITEKFYHFNFISGDITNMFIAFCEGQYLYINIGIYGALQYYIIDLVKIIPSKILCVSASLIMCCLSISLEKIVLIDTLLAIKDAPIVYYFFFLYCISIIGYFFLGVFTLFAEDTDEYILNKHPAREPGINDIYKEKLNESVHIYIYFIIIIICLMLHLFNIS